MMSYDESQLSPWTRAALNALRERSGWSTARQCNASVGIMEALVRLDLAESRDSPMRDLSVTKRLYKAI